MEETPRRSLFYTSMQIIDTNVVVCTKVAAIRRSDDGGPSVVEGKMGLHLHEIFIPDWSWP